MPVEWEVQFLRENLAFLDAQMLLQPSVNSQLGFDFQGLRRSFKENPQHPASKLIAHFGRIWIYDAALAIYADLKANRIRQAGYQAGRVMQLALQEEHRGFQGLWHFSYNTRADLFIDPRGPTGANAWCLNALYAYVLARGDKALLQWLNRAVRRFLFAQQVTDSQDFRCGLIRAGLHNADEITRGDEMGYRVYEGRSNHPYEHVILEHCADAAGTFRLAFRATSRLQPEEKDFLEELAQRHDLLMRGMRRLFWQGDHFISAVDAEGRPYPGTDGLPSIAVDNNTWVAHVFLAYDLDLALDAIRYVEKRFLTGHPPAQLEDIPQGSTPNRLEGLYYFPATFSDPFVQVDPQHRPKMEQTLQPEATFGYILFLNAAAGLIPDPAQALHLRERAKELYQSMVQLQQLYGQGGAPYASANVPGIFSTLSCVTTAASGVIATAILRGAAGDDFIGVVPPREFSVDGKHPT